MPKKSILLTQETMETILTKDNFDSEVIKSPTPVLVDFWAEWCMPSHAIAPAIADIAKTYEGRLKVGKLNVDENPDIAQNFGVNSIPNLKIFKGAKVVDEIVGVVPKSEIVKRVQKHLN